MAQGGHRPENCWTLQGNSPITALTPNCQNCQGARGPQGVAGATGRPLPTEPAQGFGFRSCRSCGPSSLLRRAPGGSRPRPTCACPCYPRGSPERTLPCPAAVGTWERTSRWEILCTSFYFSNEIKIHFYKFIFWKELERKKGERDGALSPTGSLCRCLQQPCWARPASLPPCHFFQMINITGKTSLTTRQSLLLQLVLVIGIRGLACWFMSAGARPPKGRRAHHLLCACQHGQELQSGVGQAQTQAQA